MDWLSYRRRYGTFLLSLYQTELIMFHAGEAIPHTPTKAPEDKSEIPFFLNQARSAFANVSAGYKSDHHLLDSSNIALIVFDKQKEQVLAYHELTMIIAHLEAFVGDSLLTVWSVDPETLEKTSIGRKVAENEATKLRDLPPKKLDTIAEQALWDLMRKEPTAYLAHFRDKLQLGITTNEKALTRASMDRNAIVHNNGMMNQTKYIDKLNPTDRTGLVAGGPVRVDAAYIVNIYNQALLLGQAIFEEVSKKYFGVSTPLQDTGLVALRESPNLSRNPFEDIDIGKQAMANIGGSQAALKNPQKAKAEMKRLWNENQKGEA